jgi:gas vesicle protein
MGYDYDRIEREDGGGSFLMGLLAGTVLGAGLGMLFAPKAGADTRRQLSEQANRLRSTANDTYNQASEKINQTYSQASEKLNQASEKVSQIVDRGREAYERAKTSAGPNGVNTPSSLAGTGTAGYPSTAPSNRP